MGALILLLLVMTRKIRQDQHDTLDTVRVAKQDLEQNQRELDSLQAEAFRLSTAVAARQSDSALLQQTLNDLNRQISNVQAEISFLESSVSVIPESGEDSPADAVLRSMKEIRLLKVRETTLLRQLTETEKRMLLCQQQLDDLRKSGEDATLILRRKNSELIALRKQTEAAESANRLSSGTKTLLEFSNATGTVRTPIVVDVTDGGFVFLPSGMKISPADMEGFPVRDNPFLSAVLAAHRHRSGDSVVSEPYVLLLVRPSGTVAFYGAQRILVEARIHYGYELLDPERVIVAGQFEEAEKDLIQESVREALRRRENLYARLMAMAQQNSGSPGAAGGGSDSGGTPERRMVVRPDGRVLIDEGSRRRPLDGRFYAGGVAPPRSHFDNRPAGGYRGVDPDRMTVADAERLAEDFARQYASQQSSGRSSEQLPSKSGTGPEETFNDLMRPESVSGGTNADQDFQSADDVIATSRHSAANSERPQSLLSASAPERQAEKLFETPSPSSELTRNAVMPGVPAHGRSGTRNASSMGIPVLDTLPSPGLTDTSRIDPDLLNQIRPANPSSGSLAVPVGITVFLDEHHMTVAQQETVSVDAERLDQTLVVLLNGIRAEVDDVKRRPGEPVMPIVRFVVSPGGEKWRISLAGALKQIGIRSATIYELTPYVITSDEAGRARVDSGE